MTNYDSVLDYFQGDLIVHADGRYKLDLTCHCTGKSLSEALIFASTNPQYDDRLFIELRVQYMKIASLEHGKNMNRTYCVHKLFFTFVLTFKTIYVHVLSL